MDKDESYELLGYLTGGNFEGNVFIFGGFLDRMNKYMFGDICKDFITPKLGQQRCTSEIYNKGLETISVFVLENSRKVLNSYNTLKEFFPDQNEILLNSNDVATLGNQKIKKLFFLENAVFLSGKAYEFLIEEFVKDVQNDYSNIQILTAFLAFYLSLQTTLSALAFLKVTIEDIRNNIWRVRGIVAIIPINIIKKNHLMADLFLKKSKEKQEEDRRKRKMRRRKIGYNG